MSLADYFSELEMLNKGLGGSAQNPPNCFTFMKAEYRSYESRTALSVAFPVLHEYLNPMQGMQGGFITAAFDNTFGPLSYVAARAACTTLDLHTQFIRPIVENDILTVSARILSRGSSVLTLSAEATNEKGRLIARSSATMLVLQRK